jgi:AraC-like DNA-binding protein
MMRSRVPAPPLSACVKVLWYADGWAPAPNERHMPDGSAGLIMALDGGRQSGPRAIVTGPRSTSFVMGGANVASTLVGAQFTHEGAAAFFDIPISDLRNAHAQLSDLAGLSSTLLVERLSAAQTPDARLDLLEGWLCQRMRQRRGPDRAVIWAVHQLRRPRARVADVAAHIGRSSRWFIDRFTSDVGLTPKVFSRVQRFQSALRYAHGRASVNLADLAASAGYFDQAHLAHEFRMLAGLSPSALLAGRTEFLNHIVDRS